jgi:hypothetical protein
LACVMNVAFCERELAMKWGEISRR